MFWINLLICGIWLTIIGVCIQGYRKTRKEIYWESYQIYKVDRDLMKSVEHAIYVIGVCPEHQRRIEDLKKGVKTLAEDIKRQRFGHRLVNWKTGSLINVSTFLGIQIAILLSYMFQKISFNSSFLYQAFIIHLTFAVLSNAWINKKVYALINQAEERREEFANKQDELRNIIHTLPFLCHIFSENISEDTAPTKTSPSPNNQTLN